MSVTLIPGRDRVRITDPRYADRNNGGLNTVKASYDDGSVTVLLLHPVATLRIPAGSFTVSAWDALTPEFDERNRRAVLLRRGLPVE